MARMQQRRGVKANLPSTGMLAGELMVTTDRGSLHVAIDATNKLPVVPAVDDLTTLAAVDGVADLVLIHDASEAAAQKEKKITFDNFKAALNIPPGSSDEKVAVVSGGTPGYLWGTDGTNGVVRLASGLSWTKDAGNGFVTIDANIIDGGTF